MYNLKTAIGVFLTLTIITMLIYLLYSLVRYRKEKNRIFKALFLITLPLSLLFIIGGYIYQNIIGVFLLGISYYFLTKWKKIDTITIESLKPLLKKRNFYIWSCGYLVLAILSVVASKGAGEEQLSEANNLSYSSSSTAKPPVETKKSSERKIQLSFYDPVYDLENSTYKLMITADKNKKVTIKDADGKVLLSDKPNQDERIEFAGPLSDKTQIITISDGDTVKNTTIESKVALVEKQKQEEKRIAEQQENDRKVAEEAKKVSAQNNTDDNIENSSSHSSNLDNPELVASLDNLIIENGDYINNIAPFDNSWDHIQITVVDSWDTLSKKDKKTLVDHLSNEIRTKIMGYAPEIDPTEIFFTFSTFDGMTVAESSVFDRYNIKIKN